MSKVKKLETRTVETYFTYLHCDRKGCGVEAPYDYTIDGAEGWVEVGSFTLCPGCFGVVFGKSEAPKP